MLDEFSDNKASEKEAQDKVTFKMQVLRRVMRACVGKATHGCASGHKMRESNVSVRQEHGAGDQLLGNRARLRGGGNGMQRKASMQNKGCLAGSESLLARLQLLDSGQRQEQDMNLP